MPLSNEAFDKGSPINNPKVLDFLKRNKKAYTEKELTGRFGSSVGAELLILVLVTKEVEKKLIDGDLWYRAKDAPKNPKK